MNRGLREALRMILTDMWNSIEHCKPPRSDFGSEYMYREYRRRVQQGNDIREARVDAAFAVLAFSGYPAYQYREDMLKDLSESGSGWELYNSRFEELVQKYAERIEARDINISG